MMDSSAQLAGQGFEPGFGPPAAALIRFVRVVLTLLLAAPALFGQTHWIETSFQDFRDGQVDPAMYVSHRAHLDPDSGCIEFTDRFDADNDGSIDLMAPGFGSDDVIWLFYGPDYSTTNCSLFTTMGSCGDAVLADLRLSGYSDLAHCGGEIWWGTKHGPTAKNPTTLPVVDCEAAYACDLDHDGWLDLIYPTIDGPLQIFWGSSTGFHAESSMTISGFGSLTHNAEVADLDKDGWADIVLSDRENASNPIVYWGPNRTYKIAWLPYIAGQSHGISVADLNHDGWLDIVYTGLYDASSSYIYFGGPGGFSTANRTIVTPGECYGGSAVYDFNHDSLLDIIYFRGGASGSDPGKPIIYRNLGSPPWFSDTAQTSIGNQDLAATAGFVADLDSDGSGDVFINAFSNGTRILWGPDYTRVTSLPRSNGHHGIFRNPGNFYDRSFRATYLSSVHDAGASNRVTSGTSSWKAYEPAGSQVTVLFRTGDTPSPDSTWKPFAQVDGNGGTIPDSGLGGRYSQYKLVFTYATPARLPWLEQIDNYLVFGLNSFPDVGVTQILAPPGVVDSGTIVIPAALVHNYSTQPATFPVRFRIGSSYSAETTVTLTSGATDTVAFPAWTALPRGTLSVKCTTALVNDSNPSNNARTTSVMVRVQDVGATAILRPRGSTPDGDVVIPTAVVQNFGTTVESFDVLMRIANGYDDTAHVTALAPDSIRLVNFASWTATPGTHIVRCSTMLAADMVHANDMVVDSALVAARNILVRPDTSGVVVPGDSVDYLLRVSNLGGAADTIDVWSSGTRVNWTVGLFDSSGRNPLVDHNHDGVPDVGQVAPGCTVRVLVRLRAPAQEQGNLLDTTIVFGRSGADTTQEDNARLYTQVAVLPNLAISPDQHDSTPPGQAVDYTCTVQNLGNIPDLIDLNVVRTGADTGWRYEFLSMVEFPLPDMNANGMPDVGPLAPFTGTVQFLLRVTPPANAAQGKCDTAQVWAISGTNPAVRRSITVYTTVLGEVTSLIVAPDQTDRVPGGTTQSYNLYVRLQGNMSDIVNLSAAGSNSNWVVHLYDANGQSELTDHNGDGIPDVGSVAPGTDEPFIVKVTSPAQSSGLIGNVDSLSTDFVKVVGWTGAGRTLADTANLTILMVPVLAIHNFQNPFPDQTKFVFGVPLDGRVSLVVYDRNGQTVRRLLQQVQYKTGVYTWPWDGTNDHGHKLAPGVYLYTFELETGDNQTERVNRKLMISSR